MLYAGVVDRIVCKTRIKPLTLISRQPKQQKIEAAQTLWEDEWEEERGEDKGTEIVESHLNDEGRSGQWEFNGVEGEEEEGDEKRDKLVHTPHHTKAVPDVIVHGHESFDNVDKQHESTSQLHATHT